MIQLLLAVVSLSTAPTDRWPAFRGTGDSISQAKQLPLRWGDEVGIAWTAKLTGYGQSSPVVWQDRVFVTSIDGPNKERPNITCYGLAAGRLLWREELKASQPEKVSNYISRAAPTPAVDGERIYVFFETGDLAALTHQGQVIWTRALTVDYGKFLGNHGLGSSLALTDQVVIVLVDHDGPSYLLAVDKETGETKWKSDRPQNVSWSSPIVSNSEIIVSSSGSCESVAADSGEQIWRVSEIAGNTVPSPTVTTDKVFIGSSESGENLAIRRHHEDPSDESRVAWRSQEATATFSSPLFYQGHVYMISRAGIAYCLDAKTGEAAWTRRIGGSCWASPLGACGRVYFFTKSGKTTVVASGPEFELLAENQLTTEDRVYGVAAVEKKFLIRTGEQLMCVESENEGEEVQDAGTSDEHVSLPADLPDLAKAITSFGAAVIDNELYVYGGHHGKAHHYYEQGQSGDLLRLDLNAPTGWETIATGPRLQGLAVVAHGGHLYRLGGFSARNQEDEEQDLWSVADFARFDPATKKWQELPPMPVPRSSFDATVVGNQLLVVGGWALQGGKDSLWHDTAYAVDLSQATLKWTQLRKAPFQRRALSLGTQDGNVYAIGGMQTDGKVTNRSAVYDPSTDTWSEGPELVGEEMEGFGTACCTAGGRLYISTSSGALLVLNQDGTAWQDAGKLSAGRFFHQMLPVRDRRLIVLGGASMETGKYASVEWLSRTH